MADAPRSQTPPPTPHTPPPRFAWVRRLNRHRRPTVGQLAAALLVVGVIARLVRFLLDFPLWGDEAFVAVNFLKRDFAGMWQPLLYGQIVPLGFMWAELAMTRFAGLSEYALRAIPLLAGVAALFVLWFFARAATGRRPALLALGFLAAAYYPIRHANEVKPYSTDLLVALLLVVFAWRLIQRPTTARWATLAVAAAIAVWCSYPAVFVAGGIALVLTVRLIRRRERGFVLGWAVFGVALLASWAVMFQLYAQPHAQAASAIGEIAMWQATWPPADPLKFVLWFIGTHTGNMLAYPVGGKNGGSFLTAALVIIGAITLTRRGRGELVGILLSPLLLAFVAALLHRYPYGGTARTMLYMAPAFCLLAGVGFVEAIRALVGPTERRFALRAAAILFLAIGVGSVIRDGIEPYKKKANLNARRFVRDLAERVTPEDRVFVFLSPEPDRPWAPYMFPWKGDGAQLVYYLTYYLPHEPLFVPEPDKLPPVAGTPYLVAYTGEEYLTKHDRWREREPAYAAEHDTLQAMLDRYVEAMSARYGTVATEHEVLQRKHLVDALLDIDEVVDWQVLWLYRFGPPTLATPTTEPPAAGE